MNILRRIAIQLQKIGRRLGNITRSKLISSSIETLVSLGIKSKTPQRQLMAAYFGYAVLGVVLLCLPFSSVGEIHFIDHLFTAVSAISTTGLATVDVATQYTLFGQIVVMLLIQMGGLGYMTLSAFVMLKLTGHCGNANAKIFQTQFSYPDSMDLRSMLNSTVNYTFLFEILGIALLCPYFIWKGVDQPVWSAIFHSVSAFCTAGFSIYTDNLMQFQTDWFVNIVIMVLSIMGAMGFIMMNDISRIFTHKGYKITFTSKVILSITGGLALWSTLHLFFFEDSFQAMPIGDRILVSIFQSISAMTTVGYNTVDVSIMAPISLLILSITMYIGASPSGTGGGLKSTTLSAIYAYTKNKLGHRDDVSLRGNVIPSYRVDVAITTTIFYTFILFAGIYLMGVFEPSDTDILKLSFEAASALATAGLSSGALYEITMGCKIVLIVMMYIGRVGVITFGNAILMRSQNKPTEHKDDIAV